MSKTERNPTETKRKILSAAMEEFSKFGFHGARVDRIVKVAGVNKRMVYHYFDDKMGLFKALLDQEMEIVKTILQTQPTDSVYNISRHWFEHREKTENYFKLTFITDTFPQEDKILFEKERAQNFASQIELFKKLQDEGAFPKDIAPEYFLYAVISLTAMQSAVPSFAKMVTNESPKSERFQDQYLEILKMLLT